MKEVILIEVVRLDFSSMEWKEVSSFGDHVLFSGNNTTACCSAAELGFNRGCLYYTLPEDQSLYKFEFDDTGTSILPCLKLPTPWFSSGWIMMPTTSRVGDGQKRIELTVNKCEEKGYIINPGVEIIGEAKQQPWSILDKDSLQMISSYLHPIDYKKFRQVCKANRLNLPIVKQTSTSKIIISNTYASPWLVYSTNKDCNVYTFVDPMHDNENYFMKFPQLRGATIRFQKGGWLLMSERYYRLFFHNPFTKETIELPNLPKCYTWTNISFSSLPTCSDCVVFGIKVSDNGGIGVYITARGEKSWRFYEFENIDTQVYYMPLLNTHALYKGILYCVDYNGRLGALELEDKSGTSELEDKISCNFKVLQKPYGTFNRSYLSFLVECGGDLLLVKLGRIGTFVGIFKLDFSKMEWIRIKILLPVLIWRTKFISLDCPYTGKEFYSIHLIRVVIILRGGGHHGLGLNLIGHVPLLRSSIGLRLYRNNVLVYSSE
ncbi:hypothetical protein MKW98_005434, partial [Papaver atlanticum]